MIALALGGANTAAAQTPQARIDAAMVKAKAAGLPVALLESKVAEGRAKGVSMDRIAAAVERREAALERASSVLRGPRAVDDDGLDAGADAVEQGISEAVLAAIADAAPRERRSVAIAALTELVARGRSSQNALDQVRGEACSLQFFSAGQFSNPMVVRIAGLAYQKGFGGHFHNDNSIGALRDIPGLILAVPSRGDDAAKMLRGSISIARECGRVVAFLEPIALYHERDL